MADGDLLDRLKARLRNRWWGLALLAAVVSTPFLVTNLKLFRELVPPSGDSLSVLLTTDQLEGCQSAPERPEQACGIHERGALLSIHFENTHPSRKIDIVSIAPVMRSFDPAAPLKDYRVVAQNPKGPVEESFDVLLNGEQVTGFWRSGDGPPVETLSDNLLKFPSGEHKGRIVQLGPNESRMVDILVEAESRGLHRLSLDVGFVAGGEHHVQTTEEVAIFSSGE